MFSFDHTVSLSQLMMGFSVIAIFEFIILWDYVFRDDLYLNREGIHRE